MHSTLKRGIEAALSSVPIAAVTRMRTTGRRLILAYHGIVPDGSPPGGERSLFLRQQLFSAQLDLLRQLVEVVPLAELNVTSERRPCVAITFDDAYRGAVNEGVAELVRRDLPATIFVAPGRLDGHIFWWDALSGADHTLDDSVRSHALNRLGGVDERVRAWAERIRLPASRTLPDYARSATRAELQAAVKNTGITLGSHTWSHANLATLSAEEISAELSRSADWLRANFGTRAIPWLAYPYGSHSESVQLIAQCSGYRGAVGVGGGWYDPAEATPFALPRLNVPENLSLAGFRARLIGALR
jgi:peptidoglycan/xylan/chitin deacetylase (PgdA/CDA1 family)